MKYIILQNIRSAHNVGSIFRTADGAGVDKIFLGGYTPTPIDRFGRVQPEIAKTSLGASAQIDWEHTSDVLTLIDTLRGQGFTVVAVEQGATAISISSFLVPTNVAYLLGNEVEGVSSEALAVSDYLVDIPMLGNKESLNVSVAAGIVMYHGVRAN
jgi:tRNA G18 (ribose-2'-O)-methylase SpoU